MLHALVCLLLESMRLVPYQRDDHAVKVKEEHDEVEAELDERFLVPISLLVASIFRRGTRVDLTFLWTFSLRNISVASRRCWLSKILGYGSESCFIKG